MIKLREKLKSFIPTVLRDIMTSSSLFNGLFGPLPSIGLSFACLSFLFSPSTVGGPTVAFMQLWRCHGSETETEIS